MSAAYTLERHEHGFLVLGPMPASAFKAIAALAKAEGFDLMDAGVAGAAGATLAITNKAGSEKWRAALDAAASSRSAGDAELAWLKGTDTGISSRTIFSVLSERWGAAAVDSWGQDTPKDPDDFGRCYRLLQRFPKWRNRLSEVARRHRAWLPLVKEWDRMTALYERDLPTGKSRELYELMHKLNGY